MASNVRFLDQVPVSAYGNTTALTIDTGSFMVTGSVDDNNKLTFTKGDGTTFDLQVAASASSADALVTASITGTTMSFTKGDSSTFDIALPTSSGGGSDITFNSLTSQIITDIEVKDFDTDVTVTFDAGKLTFLFGTPQAPTPAVNISGFNTDRFNKVTDDYTVSAPFNLNGYSLISASLFETTGGGNVLLQGPVGGNNTSFSISPTTTGSVSYRLDITSSNPADNSTSTTSATDSETLSKTQPAVPTQAASATVQLGATSNQIEEGATGSITFTADTGSANGWVYEAASLNINFSSPITITNSDVEGYNISASANYSSSGVDGSDNDPVLTVTKTSTPTVFSRIRSLRYGASADADLDITELRDIDAWDTSLGGTIGSIEKGTTNPVGQSFQFTWTGDKYHYIIYDSARSDLSDIKETDTQFSVLSSFGGGPYATVGDYKIYRTTAVQAGYAGTTIKYTLS